MRDFGRTRPIPSPREALVESVYRMWTARFSDFIIFPSSLNSRKFRAWSCSRQEIEPTELHVSSCLANG